MIRLVTIIFLLTIISCGKKSSGSSAPATKSMFSAWSGDNWDLDFSSYTLGTLRQDTITHDDGAICDFDSTLTGNTSSALWNITNSVYRAATGAGDPGCASYDGIYTVTMSGTTMTICDPPAYTACETYL